MYEKLIVVDTSLYMGVNNSERRVDLNIQILGPHVDAHVILVEIIYLQCDNYSQ